MGFDFPATLKFVCGKMGDGVLLLLSIGQYAVGPGIFNTLDNDFPANSL